MLENAIRQIVKSELKPLMEKLDQIIELVESKRNKFDSLEYLTRAEAAEFVRVSTSTIDRWAKLGIIEKEGVGKSTRIKKSNLLSNLDRLLAEKDNNDNVEKDSNSSFDIDIG